MMLTAMPGIFIGLTGLFIAMNARAEIMAVDVAERLDGVTVGDLTWFGVADAGTDMDADSMIWQRQRLGSAGAVAVTGDDGELDGLVLEDQLWAVPAEQRPMGHADRADGAVRPAGPGRRPTSELADVLPRLNPLRPVVTVWRDGRLLGVVPPKLLAERLKRAQGQASATD